FVEPVEAMASLDGPTEEINIQDLLPDPEDDTVIPAADEVPVTVMGDDLMPIDETADLIPTDEVRLDDGTRRWEYREIVVKTWQQHIDNIEYALSEGGEKITIEDAYTKLLNESGEQGWELVSEQVLPQQFVRLLLKRMVRS
ncbi:MAG: hypothetical protein AAF653_16160, partial [Chloroflexota bacterium]